MSPEELLAEARATPAAGTIQRRNRWTPYYPIFEELVVIKGFPKVSAVAWIAERCELDDKAAAQLYEAAVKWTLRSPEELEVPQ